MTKDTGKKPVKRYLRRRSTRPDSGGNDRDAAPRHPAAASAPAPIATDPFRTILFPNAIRERRIAAGFPSLLRFATLVPRIPYIRLSKIERGEVFARAWELWEIATALNMNDAADLLVDVESHTFSMRNWARAHGGTPPLNPEMDELAMLLAAAMRERRAGDPALTLALLHADYGLPAVIVSRIENAAKPFDRWTGATAASLSALFGVADMRALAALVKQRHEMGSLADWLDHIPGVKAREEKTRQRIRALRVELNAAPATDIDRDVFPPDARSAETPVARLDSKAVRVKRDLSALAIPTGATLLVDPARPLKPGDIVILQEAGAMHVLTVTADPQGRLYGSIHGDGGEFRKEMALDTMQAYQLAAVTAILLP